jgi:hypothetical protein
MKATLRKAGGPAGKFSSMFATGMRSQVFGTTHDGGPPAHRFEQTTFH